MLRLLPLSLFSRFCLVCICVLQTLLAEEKEGSQPNMIIIMADDLGYGDLGCFGHPTIETPNLDRLADEGAKFTSFYSAHPTCSPSRSGMMTGRTPYRSGIYAFISSESIVHLRDDEVTLAEICKAAGYSAAFYGKWGLIGDMEDHSQTFPHEQGFDHWIATHNNASPSHKNTDNFYEISTKDETVKSQPVGVINGFSSEYVVENAIRWLDRGRDPQKPFFLVLWLHEPHGPIASPKIFEDKYANQSKSRQEYYANVDHMDHQLGRLIDYLEQNNLKDETWITFTSDNGPAQGYAGNSGGLRARKGSFYEGGYRVPTIMYWKGWLEGGEIIDLPLNFFDFVPTFYELLKVDKLNDKELDGMSMLPVFKNEAFSRSVPPLWMGYRHSSLRDGDWKLWVSFRNFRRGESLTDFFRSRDVKKYELYNIKSDIAEANDLASEERSVLESMKRQYHARYAAVAAEMKPWGGANPIPKLVAKRMGYNSALDWKKYSAVEQEYLGWDPVLKDTDPITNVSTPQTDPEKYGGDME